jgi:hypothetical protein
MKQQCSHIHRVFLPLSDSVSPLDMFCCTVLRTSLERDFIRGVTSPCKEREWGSAKAYLIQLPQNTLRHKCAHIMWHRVPHACKHTLHVPTNHKMTHVCPMSTQLHTFILSLSNHKSITNVLASCHTHTPSFFFQGVTIEDMFCCNVQNRSP